MNEIELLKAQLEALKQLTEIQKQSIQQLMEQVNRLNNANAVVYPGVWNPLNVPLQPYSVPHISTPYPPGGAGGVAIYPGGAGSGGITLGQGAMSGTLVTDANGNLNVSTTGANNIGTLCSYGSNV